MLFNLQYNLLKQQLLKPFELFNRFSFFISYARSLVAQCVDNSTADLKAVRGVYWSDLCNI